MSFDYLIALITIAWLIIGFVVLKLPGHICCPIGLAITIVLALFNWHMPVVSALTAALEGVAMAVWPIGIIVIAAIFVYNLSVKTGGMDTIKTTLTAISADRRIQVLIIAWGFGGFLEGASGFGTSVAIPAAILVGLGFNPIQSCIICLLSNVPVAELGAIGIPVITGASLTNLNATTVSGFAVLQLFVLIVVCPIFMVRLAGKLKGVWATTLVSGLAFAVPAYLIGAFVGPELSTLVGAIGSLVATFAMAKTVNKTTDKEYYMDGADAAREKMKQLSTADMVKAWSPFLLMFVSMLLTSKLFPAINAPLSAIKSAVPIYINAAGERTAMYTFSWINTPGVLIFLSGVIGGLIQGASISDMAGVLGASLKQMFKSIITIVSIIAIAKVMGYAGMVADIATGMVALTGSLYPLFAPIIGGIGTFITGSVTSSCTLFSALQAQTASTLGLSQEWLVAANAAGATVGKVISPQSIAMAAAATGCVGSDGIIIRKAIVYCAIFLVFLCVFSYAGVYWFSIG
ncbi:L-lactate permease [Intestinimonas massiliensis (ex Afouda et al. 2020)]|uniref:L-lactate permease n=1 Tax=Intestinimonas massiliensis (ex Afouda et al. 2020) TaxID=1673721 RepID=UPI00067EED89|nr:L-lactate permease [Intestinimonas massiliensis (ex Afouda et al. 2020)]MBS6283047.1 L-lactate permease [Oscillospiraceae bacterium]